MELKLRTMESMAINPFFWRGKKVLITGHTGFKGSWLSLWLQQLGADVVGLALKPPTKPSLFERADVAKNMCSIEGDIRDLSKVKNVFLQNKPEIVIHLAAQSLVRYSYQNPVETYQTNVMGTLHVLEAIRSCETVRAAVMVTTDKCYENKEWLWAYRENEPMGGHDPYSSSKGCAELLIASYRQSFFNEENSPAIASARAGNVIGGGDWAEDRLIPDIIRSFQLDKPVKIRYPHAVRPWQHVLEPLSGYLMLAEKLDDKTGHDYAEAWNFGPQAGGVQSVQWIVNYLAQHWKGAAWTLDEQMRHEAQVLKLDSTKAYEKLGWRSRWSLEESLENIVSWYMSELKGMDMNRLCNEQIELFNKTGL